MPFPVVLTGRDLTLLQVVRVARGQDRVELAADAVERMRRARQVVESTIARGEAVYGVTTGVASRKRTRVTDDEGERFNRLLIGSHRVGQGPDAPVEVVRAAMLRLANAYAGGTTPARPELAERLVRALNEGETPRVRLLGSIGQADLAAQADLAHALFADVPLAAGEGLALVNSNAFGTGFAGLALADAWRLVEALEAAAALDLEAFGANLDLLHPHAAEVRPYPGLHESLHRLRARLAGSRLWEPGAPRHLQDPLSFRGAAHVLGAARDALAFARGQLEIELNAAGSNPLVVVDEGRLVSVANFEVAPLAAALDFARIALAPALTTANERLMKLLQSPFSGLPDGLAMRAGSSEDGLAELGNAGQAITAEARLLAHPVSFEVVSSTQAEGIEDRITMTPLAGRRVAEMVALGERVAAIELVVAAQAVELRGEEPLGTGTAATLRAVRELVPFTGEGQALPDDLEPVVVFVRSGLVSA